MKTTHDLRDFYEHTLADDLHQLEQKRKGLCGRLAAFGAVMGLLVIMGLLMAASTGAFPILIFVVGFGIVVFFFVLKMLSRGYVMEFKTKIIGRIVEFIDPGLRYEPTGRISRTAFQASEIFKTRPNRYKGDDYVRGKVGKTL